MCFRIFKNKKVKSKERLQFEHIQTQLVNLLNENRAIHVCLAKLHHELEGQLTELKEISLHQVNASVLQSSFDCTPNLARKNQSTLKMRYI